MENLETDSDLLTADIGDCFLRIQHEKSLVKKEDIMGRGGLRSARDGAVGAYLDWKVPRLSHYQLGLPPTLPSNA